MASGDQTREGGAHHGVLEGAVREAETGLGTGRGGAGERLASSIFVESGFRGDIALAETFRAFVVARCDGQFCAGFGQLRLGVCDFQLSTLGVDHEDDRFRLDSLAFLHANLRDLSGDLSGDRRLRLGDELSRRSDGIDHVPSFAGHHHHRRTQPPLVGWSGFLASAGLKSQCTPQST